MPEIRHLPVLKHGLSTSRTHDNYGSVHYLLKCFAGLIHSCLNVQKRSMTEPRIWRNGTMKILSTLAAMVVAFAIDGRAGSLYVIQQQAITGDHCQPVNSSVVYARDSGWITNTSGTTT